MVLIALNPDDSSQRDRRVENTSSTDPYAVIAAAARAGDRNAMRTLIVSLTPALFRIARGMLGATNPDVEDVMQETSIGIVRGLPNFRGEGTVLHFACRIAVYCALAARRKNAADKRDDRDIDVESQASEASSPARLALAARRREHLRSLFASLPDVQAEVLALHSMLGLTVEEIARATASPHETVRSRLRLAKEALRARVSRDQTLFDALEIES